MVEREKFVDYVYNTHLQTTSGRESLNEMFRLGIEAAYKEAIDLFVVNDGVKNKLKKFNILFRFNEGEDKSCYEIIVYAKTPEQAEKIVLMNKNFRVSVVSNYQI